MSAGIDVALHLTAQLTAEPTARRVQLALDYDPRPPFGGIDRKHDLPSPVLRRGITLGALLLGRKAKRLQRLEAARAA